MRLPTTAKGYLKMLIAIAEDSGAFELKGVDNDTVTLISNIRADIQNELSDDENEVLIKHKLRYDGYQ